MDAYKDALKKKLEMLKGGHKPDLEIQIGMEDKDKQGSDLAPDIDDKEQMMAQHDDLQGLHEDGSEGEELDPSHMEVLKALADKSHIGRDAGGLGERAAALAKSKMGSLKKK